MSEMVTLKIDNQEVQAAAGTTVLEAARKVNIQIPNLCSNAELEPYGACRMCMVEITHGKWYTVGDKEQISTDQIRGIGRDES